VTKENETKEATKSVIKDMIARNEKTIEELSAKKRFLLNPHERTSTPDSYLFNPPPTISPAMDFELGVYDPKEKEEIVEKEAQPKVDSIEFPINVPPSAKDTFEAYESYIEELKRRLMESLETKKDADQNVPSTCTEELQAIIGRFNNELNDWYKRTGCTATFGWNYGGNKNLELLGIDLYIYRKPPPSETTLSQVLKNHAHQQ